jgi:hypothetical protein
MEDQNFEFFDPNIFSIRHWLVHRKLVFLTYQSNITDKRCLLRWIYEFDVFIVKQFDPFTFEQDAETRHDRLKIQHTRPKPQRWYLPLQIVSLTHTNCCGRCLRLNWNDFDFYFRFSIPSSTFKIRSKLFFPHQLQKTSIKLWLTRSSVVRSNNDYTKLLTIRLRKKNTSNKCNGWKVVQ